MHIKQDINNSRIEFENKIKQENEILEKKKIETEKSLFKIKDEMEKEMQREKEANKNKAVFDGTFAPQNIPKQPNRKPSLNKKISLHDDTGELSREEGSRSKGDSPPFK